MIRNRTLALTTLALTSTAYGVQAPERIPGPVRHAGVYHVTTGTWTRAVSATAGAGADVIYNNAAPSGYFSPLANLAVGNDATAIDQGRVPTTASGIMGTAPVTRDAYSVNGIEFSYCTDVQGPNVGIEFSLYDTYTSCDTILTDPQAPFHVATNTPVTAMNLPGAQGGGVACWTMTIDLSGGSEFCLIGDGGPVPSGSNTFGLSWTFPGTSGSNTGPILGGDPTSTGSVAGADIWGGGGTYYDSMHTCSGAGTGLDTEDQFALDGDGLIFTPGCLNFLGYANLNGCGGPSMNPLASFQTRIFSDLSMDPDCSDPNTSVFCEPAGTHSGGDSVSLAIASIPNDSGIQINARGGPANSGPGFFLVSAGAGQSVPIGQGTLCLDPRQGRYSPNAGAALNSLGMFDANGDFTNASATSISGFGFDIPSTLPEPPSGSINAGSTWYFQLWYSDMNQGSTSNFSNGLAITF